MKTRLLTKQSKLTNWLLIVALLCSLLICLGRDSSNQNCLPTSVKTELALATKPTVKQAKLVQKRQSSSTFYAPSRLRQFAAIVLYNERVTLQLKIVRLINSAFMRFAYFVPVKTIPASTDEPFSDSLRG